MTSASVASTWTYDDFTRGALDPARWRVVEMTGAGGVRHEYRDANARVGTGDGRLT